jgi:hypothetical protein
MLALNPVLDALRSTKQDFPKEMEKHFYDLVYLCLAYASGYVYRLGKNWYQHGNTPDRQAALCLEAERLLKIRATLSNATDPVPKVTSAQAVVGNQLNQVLEKLSHLLTEPEVLTQNSYLVEVLGKYLLLYRSTGIVSALMHWIFYFLVLVWGLFVYIGSTTPGPGTGAKLGIGTNIAVALILLIPVVIWNYLTRKVDGWQRSRRAASSPATIAVSPK